MADWRIWYGDDTTYSDDDGPVWDAPPTNVVCVATENYDVPGNHSVVHAFDYYWWDPPEWYGGDLFGVFDYLCRPGPKKIVFGRTIPTSDFRRILMSAIEGGEFKRGPK